MIILLITAVCVWPQKVVAFKLDAIYIGQSDAAGRKLSTMNCNECGGGQMKHDVNTSQLMQMLQKDADVSTLRDISALGDCDFPHCLKQHMQSNGISATELMKAADISKTYIYQILRGERRAGRDVVLRISLVLKLAVEDAQRLLTLSENGTLYPRVRRDAAVIFALNKGMSLSDADELICSLPERTLYSIEVWNEHQR